MNLTKLMKCNRATVLIAVVFSLSMKMLFKQTFSSCAVHSLDIVFGLPFQIQRPSFSVYMNSRTGIDIISRRYCTSSVELELSKKYSGIFQQFFM